VPFLPGAPGPYPLRMANTTALSGLKPGWTAAFILLGLLTLALLLVSVIVNVVWATVAIPAGIGFGWVAGRIYEARAALTGAGVRQ
jgi:hypothetical protein